jgi:hypothetical protein
VRVKVTPSSKSRSRSSNDHIQITGPRGTRNKATYTQRIPLSDRHEKLSEIEGDDNSVNSYRSATEESNVTSRGGGPIEVEIMPKRHGSPLIPNTESNSRYIHVNPSEISSMPADSFLDGNTRSPERKGSRSLSRGEALMAGAATGMAAAVVADKLKTPSRRRSRSLSRERIVAQKAVEKVRGDKSERRRKHRSRSRSISGEHSLESMTSPRRRSSRGHHGESLVSGVDSSLLNSNSHVSGRSGESFRSGTSKSSINNPKLLETVEDAIRRLILPELTALKREQSKHAQRDRDRDRRGSVTSGSGVSRDSRDEYSSTRRQSDRGSGTDSSGKPRVVLNDSEVLSGNSVKGRKDKNIDRLKLEDSPRTFERETSEETVVQGGKLRKKHSGDRHHGLEAAAVGAGAGALAGILQKHHSQDSIESERKERRRRRTKSHSRSDSLAESYEEREIDAAPPMPMMSEINPSEITRTSILSADTDRPQSASQERVTPIREVPRGVASPSSRTPTRTPIALQQGLGTQHSNYSRGNLSLQQSPTEEQLMHGEEYEIDEHGHKIPMPDSPEHDQDDSFVDEEQHHDHNGAITAGLVGAAAGAGLAAMHHHNNHDDHDDPELLEDQVIHNDYYHQEVPPPLRYVPYAQERRGLSPIQSVSGYTEGDPDQLQRDSRLTQSTGSYSSLNRSVRRGQSGLTTKSIDSLGNVHTNPHDFKEVRHGELADSEITQDGEYWEEQHQENDRQRDLDHESYRSSDYKHMTNYTDDSMDGHHLDRVASGQNVRGVGANPNFVHTPIGVESAVASLVNASELTGGSGYTDNRGPDDRRESYASYEDGSERHFTSPGKQDATRDVEYDGSDRGSYSQRNSPSKYAEEYDLDEQGRKVAMPKYKGTHAAEAVLAAGAAGAAAVLIAGRNRKSAADQIQYPSRQEDTGAPLHKSFKDRAQEVQGQIPSPRQSINGQFSDAGSHDHFAMGASGLPDPHNPMPEIGFGGVDSDVETNPSVIQGPIAGVQEGSQEHWPGKQTPPQAEYDAPIASREQKSDANLKAAEAALVGAAAGLGGAEALASHSRDNSHDHDEEWQRTSGERKRDTLITNPYEGTSPIAAIGALDHNLLGQGLSNDFVPTKLNFQNGRTLASPKDEGYISSAPNNARSPGAMTPEQRSKGVGFMDQDLAGVAEGLDGEDPFYAPKHSRHLSGMSHGMGSPIYDSATGNGIDRIQSKDIVALMDHVSFFISFY